MKFLVIFQRLAQLYLENVSPKTAETQKEPPADRSGMSNCTFFQCLDKLQQRQSLCLCVIFVAAEMDKMKLDDADNGFDNIGETEACKKLNELKQEPEEKSTVPQVFKKVY